MVIAVFFKIDKKVGSMNALQLENGLKPLYIHPMEYNSAVKKERTIYNTHWINLSGILLSKPS